MGTLITDTEPNLTFQIRTFFEGISFLAPAVVVEDLPPGIASVTLQSFGFPIPSFIVTWDDPDMPLEVVTCSQVVPEPSAGLLSLVAVVALALVRKRKSK